MSIPLTHSAQIFAALRSTGAISPYFQLLSALVQLDDEIEKLDEKYKKEEEDEEEFLSSLNNNNHNSLSEKKKKNKEQMKKKEKRNQELSKTHTTLRWILDAHFSHTAGGGGGAGNGNLNIRNLTPVLICVHAQRQLEEQTKALKLLLSRGASPNIPESSSYKLFTPLFSICFSLTGTTAMATTFPKEPMARLLLEHGARVNARAAVGSYSARAPLHYAAEKGNLPAICVLLEFGADLWMQDSSGMTPLMIALRGLKFDAAHNLFLAMKGQCLEQVQKQFENNNNENNNGTRDSPLPVISFRGDSKNEQVQKLREQVQFEADKLFASRIYSIRNKADQTAVDIAYAKNASAINTAAAATRRTTTNPSASTTPSTRPESKFSFILDWHEENVSTFRDQCVKEEVEKVLMNRKEEMKKNKNNNNGDDLDNNNGDDVFDCDEIENSSTTTKSKIKELVQERIEKEFPVGNRIASANPGTVPSYKQPTAWQWITSSIDIRSRRNWQNTIPFISSFGIWIAYVLVRKNLLRRGIIPASWFTN